MLGELTLGEAIYNKVVSRRKRRRWLSYISVRYVAEHPAVIIGADPSYNVLALRQRTEVNRNYRTVVAMEYKKESGGGFSGKLYEIGGVNCGVEEENALPASHGGEGRSDNASPFLPQSREDGIVTRMHFYRDTYNGEDNSENSALLLNMTDYLNRRWDEASESEQNMILLILQDMANRSKAKIHRDLISQCARTLKNGEGDEVMKRMDLYVQDYRSSNTLSQKSEVLNSLEAYVRKMDKQNLSDKTLNDVYEVLIRLKRSASTLSHENHVGRIVTILSN